MSEIKKKICIIDYGSGNIGSVSNVLNKLNLNYCVSNSIEDFKNSSHFILWRRIIWVSHEKIKSKYRY